MTTEDLAFIAKITEKAIAYLAIMPNANRLALHPTDHKRLCDAIGSPTTSVLAGSTSLRLVEDPNVRLGNVSLQEQ